MSGCIAVVGAANIDVGGRSFSPLVSGDSNPGVIRSSLGGVGRNIAHNLALLGVPVKLVTALGDDDGARRVRESCRALGIDLLARTVSGAAAISSGESRKQARISFTRSRSRIRCVGSPEKLTDGRLPPLADTSTSAIAVDFAYSDSIA